MWFGRNVFVSMVKDFQKKFSKLGCWKRDYVCTSAEQDPTRAAMICETKSKIVDLRLAYNIEKLKAIAQELERDYKHDNDPRALRLHLLVEETAEYGEAMLNNDRVKIADALGDVIYVAIGGTLVYNIHIESVFSEIHRSNMSKTNTDGDGRMRDKGPLYSPPDIEGALHKGDELIQWTNTLETVDND